MNNLENLFSDKNLYQLALTHKSWVNEHAGTHLHNERLEFLGDAVLEFIVSKEIYSRFPDKEEGYLTALRASLVNTVSLSEVAQELKLGEALLLSKGEEETGGRSNTSILANTVEAIIGALYLDQGIEEVEKFIDTNLLSNLDKRLSGTLKDAKSLLQEYVQAQGLPAPRYDVVDEKGPDHAKVFTIEAVVSGKTLGKGKGKNKGEAAQAAAQIALKKYLKLGEKLPISTE